MSETTQLRIQRPGLLALTGDLTFDTVQALLRPGWLIISQQGSQCEVDWSQVRRIDSAALAIGIDWLRCARADGVSLKYINTPESFRKLGEVCGIDKLVCWDI